MKAQLGRSHISFQKIADCILRLPTYDSQYTAFQQVNALLTGTAWQEKAEDVLNQMFARVKQQTPDVKIAIRNFTTTRVDNILTNPRPSTLQTPTLLS